MTDLYQTLHQEAKAPFQPFHGTPEALIALAHAGFRAWAKAGRARSLLRLSIKLDAAVCEGTPKSALREIVEHVARTVASSALPAAEPQVRWRRVSALLMSSKCRNAGAILSQSSASTPYCSKNTRHSRTTAQIPAISSAARAVLIENRWQPARALSIVALRPCGPISRCNRRSVACEGRGSTS